MVEEITKAIAPYIVIVVSLLMSWLTYELKRYINSKTQNEAAIAGLKEFGAIAATTVQGIAQTAAGSLADGKFTKAEGDALKEEATETIKGQITSALKAKLALSITDLPAFVESQTQSAVLDVKIAKAAVGLPPHNEPTPNKVDPEARPLPFNHDPTISTR